MARIDTDLVESPLLQKGNMPDKIEIVLPGCISPEDLRGIPTTNGEKKLGDCVVGIRNPIIIKKIMAVLAEDNGIKGQAKVLVSEFSD